jgi:hypothetical protein
MEDKAPKIPKFDLTASSDLLSRLGSFLPQLQAANELLAQEPNTDSLVDADLAIEGGGSDVEPEALGDDDSENENGESHGDEEVDMETKPQQQTIQLRLAVGNVEENPGISWLAAQDEDEEEEEEAPPHENDDEREREPVSQVESTISSLLGKGKEQKTQPKGPLITEME